MEYIFDNIFTAYRFLDRSYLILSKMMYFLVFLGQMSYSQTTPPFKTAYHAGILSSDRFSSNRGAGILQPSILPDMISPFISSAVQSRFSGFGIYALGLHMGSPLPGNFGIGLSIMSVGANNFKSTELIVSAGKKLNKRLGIGFSQSLQRSIIAGAGRPWNGSTAVAASYTAAHWGVAIHMTGLMRWGREYYPDHFSTQLASFAELGSHTRMFFLVKYVDRTLYPVAGIRQVIIRDVELFGAFQLYPARYGLGIVLPLSEKLFTIVSTQYLPVLGWSPSIGMRWAIRKQDDQIK